MNILALDTECHIFSKTEKWKGNPYGDPRPPVCWSEARGNTCGAWRWYEHAVKTIQDEIDVSDLVVGFNLKYDVSILKREGVDFSKVPVWDCQLAEFVISRQLNRFPSLNDSLIKYGLPTKLDVVKTEYWEKGIDNDEVPWELLKEYAADDAAKTLAVYHAQLPHLTPKQIKLVKLMSQDLLVLQEMESNGLVYDEALCKQKEQELSDEISKITAKLAATYPDIPINFNSTDDLSAFLYGGIIEEIQKEHIGFFKSGIKKGEPKYQNVVIQHQLPRLFEPVKGSELKKQGLFETNEGALKKLTGKYKPIVEDLLRLSKLEKLVGTYYRGLPQLNKDMHWPAGRLHGQFNQTLAISGRLSSSKPNQQNFASELQDVFISEYQ